MNSAIKSLLMLILGGSLRPIAARNLETEASEFRRCGRTVT